KFHIFLHLVKHADRFGPPALFMSEHFERFNQTIREASIYSSRKAPSRDIAHRFITYNVLSHILAGGVWIDK
ncbi:hypothetical protein DFS34DRAFT_564027, partial [Phlyctochytrium arcticum]